MHWKGIHPLAGRIGKRCEIIIINYIYLVGVSYNTHILLLLSPKFQVYVCLCYIYTYILNNYKSYPTVGQPEFFHEGGPKTIILF